MSKSLVDQQGGDYPASGYTTVNAPAAHPRLPSLAYLVSQYPAIRHTFILREVQQLRRMGLAVETVSIRAPQLSTDLGSAPEVQEAARTFYVKSRSFWKVLVDHLSFGVRRPFRYLSGLSRALRFGGYDLKACLYHLFYFIEAVVVGQRLSRKGLKHIHVHFANSGAIVALLIERMYGIQYSLTVHGSDEFYDVRFYHLREVIEHASFACCISRFCRSQIMKETAPEHWDKLEVSPLGVDPSVFLPRHAHERPFTIACTGGLVFGKGQMGLLAAVAELRSRGHAVRLELVGDGPARGALEREAARLHITADVTFHGFVAEDDVRAILARTSVFVLPSFAEGVPVSLMEAMSMEVPCVSTYVGGIPELIHSGQDGILISPGDTGLLVDAIEELIDNPLLRQRLAKAGRRKVTEAYDLQASTERLVSIFERRLGAAVRIAAAAGA
jgi:colanic acid/amylovoran biosynthesis glycosyltransferase